MTKIIARIVEPVTLKLQHSKSRIIILKYLLSFDNFLRRWITFFSFENDTHPKHRLTQYHQFFLSNISTNDNVLDVGCGLGQLTCDISQQAKQVTGIDSNQNYLKQARIYCPFSNVTFIHGDATSYDFIQKFDVLILSNVLEHIADRPKFLRKLKMHSTKFLIRVPMIDRDWIVPLKQELNIEHRLDPTHYTEYTEKQFRQELAAANLEIIELSSRFGEIYCVARPS